jgi:hypothetical protein
MIRRTGRSLRVLATYGVVLATASLLKACSPGDHATESLVGAPTRPMEAKPPSELPALSFRQIDFTLDDGKHNNSAWGNAELTYVGVGGVVYFNLVVGGRWVVVNFPVTSPEGDGLRQTLDFHFDLGTAEGKNVSKLEYAFALTAGTLASAPSNVARAHVEKQRYELHTGVGGHLITFSAPGGVLMAAAAAGDKTTHKGFPNQEAGDFECAPVAASNSLQWLNATQKLNIAAGDISIDAMKAATKFSAAAKGSPDNWPELKDAYLKSKQIAITTTRLDRLKLSEVEDAMKRGCDVELSVLRRVDGQLVGHVVAITSIQKLDNGDYALVATHDTDQGVAGGTANEAVTYDNAAGRFKGPTWINNKSPDSFISECANGGS